MNGRALNHRWNVNARHALFRQTGNWYHLLTKFPGALFDPKGYLLFETEEDYRACKYINLTKEIWVPNPRGISSVPGYVQVVIDGSEYIPPVHPSTEPKTGRVYFEGNPVSVTLTKFERDRTARAECLHHYGYLCCICQFDFAKIYGEIATTMIHVHHLTPISLIGETYWLDPIKDLRPICPNCHAVIHKRRPPFSIEDVQKMINNAKKG
jgi:hypothetical protein